MRQTKVEVEGGSQLRAAAAVPRPVGARGLLSAKHKGPTSPVSLDHHRSPHHLFDSRIHTTPLLSSTMSPQLPQTFSRWRVNPGQGFDGLELVKDQPLAQPKRSQVVVKVHAVSLQYRDLAVAKGLYPAEMPPDVRRSQLPGSSRSSSR
jgi:hypothetical protein